MKYLLLIAGWLAAGTALAQTTLPRPTEAEHAQAVTAFQTELNAEYRNPSESPLSEQQRATFSGLPFYPTSYAACVVARFEADSLGAPFPMPTSTARRPLYRKYGVLHFTLEDGQPRQLTVYQSLDLQQNPQYRDYLFLPFTDATNGHGSYGGGRFLDLRRGQIRQGQLVLDFNRAYNPYCAYGSYSCPVPPRENRLPVAVKAGVMHDH